MEQRQDPRQVILDAVRDRRDIAHAEWRRAAARSAASQVGHKVWDEHNPDDGVGCMGSNPYNPRTDRDAEMNCAAKAKLMDEAYELAIRTFIGE